MKSFRYLFAVGAIATAIVCSSAVPADAGHHHHQACCDSACTCCEPPPVEVTWCVHDPVTCCDYKVSACVPACCAGIEPCLDGCRRGWFGRKILTYKFPCCDHCVDVVITKHGRTIVRD